MNTLENDQRLVLVDDLEGTVHRAYGALPNYVDIIDPQGTVVFRSDWNKPKAVREALRGGPACARAQGPGPASHPAI